MRTSHWWGATLGAGVVASAAFLAPSALAAGPALSRPAPQHKVVTPTKTAPHKVRVGERDQRGRGRAHGCFYPPNSSYNVVIKGTNASRRGVSITGSAKVDRCGFAGKTVNVYQVRRGSKGFVVGSGTTDSGGNFTVSFDLPRKGGNNKILLVAAVAGDGTIGAGRSEVFSIEKPRHF
jgi:hypothetical protein